MTMADRIAVMNGGRLQQLATPDEMYKLSGQSLCRRVSRQPADEHTSGPAIADGHLSVPGGWSIPEPSRTKAPAELRVGHATRIDRVVAAGTPGAAPASVIVSEPLGSEVIVNVNLGETMVRVRTSARRPSPPGRNRPPSTRL